MGFGSLEESQAWRDDRARVERKLDEAFNQRSEWTDDLLALSQERLLDFGTRFVQGKIDYSMFNDEGKLRVIMSDSDQLEEYATINSDPMTVKKVVMAEYRYLTKYNL